MASWGSTGTILSAYREVVDEKYDGSRWRLGEPQRRTVCPPARSTRDPCRPRGSLGRKTVQCRVEMGEKEVRTCIEQFLRRTARNVVMPASVGLGLAASGCSSQTRHAGVADGGRDTAAQISDVVGATPDAAADVAPRAPEARDLAAESDLPLMAIPYIVALPQDAADAEPGRDSESEAGARRLDGGAEADVWIPPIIYGVFIQPPTSPSKR
jgi:hypothetical protein